MKFVALSIALLLPTFAPSLQAEEFDKQKAIADARAATKAFAGSLKTELIAAMQAGGPVNALGVCNLEAMPITTRVGESQNAQISRVSLKNRNPDNAPNDWQSTVLEDFDTRAANGEDIATMASVSVVDVSGKKQLRFMKAVPTEGACLACHGQTISTEVTTKLNELYPQDKATGYTPGQVRGAIVVVKEY